MSTTEQTAGDVRQIYAECRAATEVFHGTGSEAPKGAPKLERTASQPRLRHLNHLELKRSRTVRNPIARVGLFFLGLYEGVRDGLKAALKRLFPRRARIYAHGFNAYVQGHLTYGQKKVDTGVPVHHMHVALWARTWWGGFRKLGEAVSRTDGRFRIAYDNWTARAWRIRKVWLEIHHTGNHRWDDGKPVNDYILFKRVKIKKGDLVGIEYDTGTLQLFYWEYDPIASVARVIIRDHEKDAPQKYSLGRLEAIERQFIPIELIKDKHIEEIRLAPGKLTIDKIQGDYPENLTVCMELNAPGSTRSDAWFGERYMNGMFASDFDRDPDRPDLLWVHHHWSSYDHTNDYALPDVDIYFRMQPNGLPLPVEIRLAGPLNRHELDQKPRRTFTPEDGEKWTAAKKLARVSGALYTELVHHFCGTHLNTEQFAIAAYRNLRLSPLTTLLFPHIKEVVLVDHTADRILVGNGYITHATALTPKGIGQLVTQVMGTLDWKNWRPMEPLSDAHDYAHASNLYWSILQEYVDDFIKANAEQIRAHWYEVYRFSTDLVEHSPPAFVCGWLRKRLYDLGGGYRPDEDHPWYTKEQRMDLSLPREETGGAPRAMSRITSARQFDAAGPEDWDNLKQACAYVLFQSTFGHTWANSKQYDDIGEVRYNSLGLRFGDGPDGVLAPETDDRILPDLTRATQMMWWSNMLSRTGYGYIMANEDGDINPALIEALTRHREGFERFGLPIEQIQSRTNI